MAVCYRHPGRETGVSCSSCERPICPDCMTVTPVGMRCPECARGAAGAGLRGGGRARSRPRVRAASRPSDEPTLTYILIGINVALGLGTLISGANTVGADGFAGNQLLIDGAVSRPAVADGEWWRILTAGFLHSGFFHLLFNMFGIWILGGLLEPGIGRLRVGIIYFVSLLAGSFGALLLEPTAPTVGASGAVFGLMGAAIIAMRAQGISAMESGLGLWLGLNLLITFAIPNISIGGHLGGLAGGMLAAALMFGVGNVRVPPVAANALASAIGVLAVVGSIAVASG
jgi:membrane associated rhomboid family serine protease